MHLVFMHSWKINYSSVIRCVHFISLW